VPPLDTKLRSPSSDSTPPPPSETSESEEDEFARLARDIEGLQDALAAGNYS